jgi:hypothetical protein
MAETCDLDGCSLKGDIEDMKDAQKELSVSQIEMNTTQKLFIQKVDGYLERGKEEHDILFERTRDVAKKEDIKGMATWKEIIMASNAKHRPFKEDAHTR